MEEDGLAVVDAVENPAVAVGPEGQHVVLQRQPLGQRLGPVARPRHQVRAGILGDVGGDQFARVQAGEAESEGSAPAAVHAGQAEAHLEYKDTKKTKQKQGCRMSPVRPRGCLTPSAD